jgi:hypothetical protein
MSTTTSDAGTSDAGTAAAAGAAHPGPGAAGGDEFAAVQLAASSWPS